MLELLLVNQNKQIKHNWNTVKFPGQARYGAAGVVLNSKYYFHGGYAGSGLTTFYSFDPTTKALTPLQSSPEARCYHNGFSHNGNIYFYGGWKGNFVTNNELVRYEVSTGLWSVINTGTFPAQETDRVKVGNKVYFLASGSTSVVFYLDLDTFTYHTLTTITESAGFGPSPRMVAKNGFLYIFQGQNQNYRKMFIVSLANGSYEILNVMPNDKYSGVPYVIKNKIYYHGGANITGYTGTPSLQSFDMDTKTWKVEDPNLHYVGSENIFKSWAAQATDDKAIFCFGGYTNNDNTLLMWMDL